MAQSGSAESMQKIDGYKLVWSDEFNKDGPPDKRNWRFENGFVRNEEQQWYQPNNAWCENGKLIIEGRKEKRPNPSYVPGSNEWRKQKKILNIPHQASKLRANITGNMAAL